MMKKVIFVAVFLFFIGLGFVSAQETHVYYFYGTGCSHCAAVADSGILENVSLMQGVLVDKLNLYESQENRDLFNYFADGLEVPSGERGVPLAVIECGDSYSYLVGDTPIIGNLGERIRNCEGILIDEGPSPEGSVTFLSVIAAAVIDSINPCAFGVLIFLMASLLKMGSSRRALHAGLIYSLVVFIVYFFVGWGLFRVIDVFASSSYFYYFYAAVALVIFILGLVQLKDVFFYGKGFTLRISPKVKPLMENFMSRGTLGSIIVLGILVSMFELPCTGEIYIGILTLMSIHEAFGLFYLFVYNLVFVLPLLILTYLIYKGTSTQRLQAWTVSNRKYMKLVSGLLLIGLATYIFVKSMGFI